MSLAILASPKGSINFAIVAYQIGLTSQMQSAQLHYGLQHYPIKALQADFQFTVQFNSEEQYEAAQKLIIESGNASVSSTDAAGGAMRLYWPDFNLDYLGFVKASPMGVKKFDFAPRVTYTMTLIKDSLYTVAYDYTDVPSWQEFFTDNIDLDAALKLGDEAVAEFTKPATDDKDKDKAAQPAAPAPAATNPAPAPAPAVNQSTAGSGGFWDGLLGAIGLG